MSATKESRIVTAAVEAAVREPGVTRASIAEAAGVSPGMLYQWAKGIRPVAPEKAAILAQVLGIDDPAMISPGYTETVAQAVGTNALKLKPDTRSQEAPADLAIARLQNDVHALSLALGAFTAVMVAHRPAEAKAAAAAIRRNVPGKFRDQGLIRELLSVLDQS